MHEKIALALKEEHRMSVIESKVLKRIFGRAP
jgi:hypothetical protein